LLARGEDLGCGEVAEPEPALRLLTLLLFHVIQTGETRSISSMTTWLSG